MDAPTATFDFAKVYFKVSHTFTLSSTGGEEELCG